MLLEDYLRDLSAASEKSDLSDLLIRAFSDIGATAIVGQPLSFGGSGVIRDWNPIVSTFPPSIIETYAKYRHAGDPFFEAALAFGEPVHYQRIIRQTAMNDAQRLLFSEMENAGLRDGVASTVIIKPGVAAYFVAVFPEIRTNLTAIDLRRIHILFSEYYWRYCQISRQDQVELSPREQQILVGIIAGKSNAEIGHQLKISKATVDTYVRRCFEKLDVSSRMEAALKFFSLGLQLDKIVE